MRNCLNIHEIKGFRFLKELNVGDFRLKLCDSVKVSWYTILEIPSLRRHRWIKMTDHFRFRCKCRYSLVDPGLSNRSLFPPHVPSQLELEFWTNVIPGSALSSVRTCNLVGHVWPICSTSPTVRWTPKQFSSSEVRVEAQDSVHCLWTSQR